MVTKASQGFKKGRYEQMRCKNPYCKALKFAPVLELDSLIGVICKNCGARYIMEDLEIRKSLKREGWNSAKWVLK